MKITTVSEMRAMDGSAIEHYGIPEIVLMENAGMAAFSVLAAKTGIRGKQFLVFCGSGNNGGDGFVVARKIHSNGGHVEVVLMGNREKIKGISKTNLDILTELSVPVTEVETAREIRSGVAHCDAVVDAILGTGLSKEVRGHYREVIEQINASGKPVLSLDIPSGINGDTGEVMGCAVRANWTVTFGLPKIGNLLYPGFGAGGELYVTFISFPPAMTEADTLKIAVNTPLNLPDREINGHKGDFGDVLFISGAPNYYGAPYFSAMSFMKTGGGYARLAAPTAITPFIAGNGSEIVFIPQRETVSGSIAQENASSLLALSGDTDMTVMGPGLSLDGEPRRLVLELTRSIPKPLLLDGDGITAVCGDLDAVRSRKAPTILTPHPGEMARITGLDVPAINADRVRILQQTAADLNAHVVLKGAHSLVGFPDRRVFVNLSGNSGMATAGSGDVLAGIIAAMFGLGLPVPEAVRKGVFIHGFAGDLAASDLGEDGITARDIMSFLPAAMKLDRTGLNQRWQQRYAGARIVS